MEKIIVRTGIGQDSHRFLPIGSSKVCILGGVVFEDVPGFNANSDGDVVIHALCNAISSLTGVLILGQIADDLCLKNGITDSAVFLSKGVELLYPQRISHVAISIEGKKPRLKDKIDEMRQRLSTLLGIDLSQIGITATSGEGLTDFGCGDGVQALAIITTETVGKK